MWVTERYSRQIIEAAQVAGARATHDKFFPVWRVHQFWAAGKLKVEFLPKKINISVHTKTAGTAGTAGTTGTAETAETITI